MKKKRGYTNTVSFRRAVGIARNILLVVLSLLVCRNEAVSGPLGAVLSDLAGILAESSAKILQKLHIDDDNIIWPECKGYIVS